MKKISSNKKCNIGEGPIWNDKDKLMYFVNGFDDEICTLNLDTGEVVTRKVDVGVAAIAFTKDYRMIVSRSDGVFILNDDDTTEKLYDTDKFDISYANDMKVGPDGRIYVGTQCTKRLGLSDRIDGKLVSIDRSGNVRTLLEGLILSNGLDWSPDKKRFYHTDSETKIIREYDFDIASGDISFTGREVNVFGADGFTVDQNGYIYAASWGGYRIHIIDPRSLQIVDMIEMPARATASCGFGGDDMKTLVAVTASYYIKPEVDPNAGFVFTEKLEVGGIKPYLF